MDGEDELRMAKLRQTMALRWNELYPTRKRELSARDQVLAPLAPHISHLYRGCP